MDTAPSQSVFLGLSLCLWVSLCLFLSPSLSLCVYLCLSLCVSAYLLGLSLLPCLSLTISLCLSFSLHLSLSVSLCLSLHFYLCLSLSLCLCVSHAHAAGVARAEARSCSCREQRASRRTKREDRAARGPDPGLPRPAAQSREARDRASPREWVRGSLAAGSVTQENPYKAEHADESLGKAKAENSSSPQRRARPQASDPGRAESAGSQAEVEPEGAPGPLPGC